MSYDQIFRTESGPPSHLNAGKWPHVLFGDAERGTNGGYMNNSLEGLYFDDATLGYPTPGGGTGDFYVPGIGVFRSDFYYYESLVNYYSIVSAQVTNGICSIETSVAVADLAIGDLVSVTGMKWDTAYPYINGVWKITYVSGSEFRFEINAPNSSGEYVANGRIDTGRVMKSHVFEIRDNRAVTDGKGQSFTSVLFTPKYIHSVPAGYRRVLPSDLYTRFRFQTGSDINPAGGINTNLFNIIDNSNNNIKPVLWSYFFGYSSDTAPSNALEVAFNSYAVVLRPSGEGSRLEFALLKFNWGTLPSNWFTNVIDAGSDRYKDWSSLDLGYLIATNPEVGKIAGSAVVNELATSDSFTYSSDFTAKFNLKITIRKHLLSDSELDGTYLVNLMINDDYDSFGEGIHYDSILHAYIRKPEPLIRTVGASITPSDYMLMPMLYFKFNNINKDNVGAPNPTLQLPGSSKIVQDSLMFRQINASASTTYLY